MAAVGTDLVLIERDGVLHKATAQQIANLGGGGGGGSQEVFVQMTRPVSAGPWLWWQTDATGSIIDLTVNDGA